MNSSELVVGSMCNQTLQFLKINDIILEEKELMEIFINNLFETKEDVMIELTRENGNGICQNITSQILKIIEPNKIHAKLYLDIYFYVLSLLWQCLPELENSEDAIKEPH